LFRYVFAHEFLFNPQFDLEPDYIIGNSTENSPSPTPLTMPNGIRIDSPVSPLLTCEDRQMGQAKVLCH